VIVCAVLEGREEVSSLFSEVTRMTDEPTVTVCAAAEAGWKNSPAPIAKAARMRGAPFDGAARRQERRGEDIGSEDGILRAKR
jgi:methenyltetrahydromethanopterin cyclohydrolase